MIQVSALTKMKSSCDRITDHCRQCSCNVLRNLLLKKNLAAQNAAEFLVSKLICNVHRSVQFETSCCRFFLDVWISTMHPVKEPFESAFIL